MSLIGDIFIATNKGKMEKAYHDMMNDPRLIAAQDNFDASRDELDRAMGNPILTLSQRRIMYGMAELYCLSEDNKKFFKSSEGRESFINNIMNVSNTTKGIAIYILDSAIRYGKIHEELVEHKAKNKLNITTETKKVEERVEEKTPEELEKLQEQKEIMWVNIVLTIIIALIFQLSAWATIGVMISIMILGGIMRKTVKYYRRKNEKTKSVVEKPKTIKNKRIKSRL